MIDQKVIDNLTPQDIRLLDLGALSQPITASRLEVLANDSIYDTEPGEAREFYEDLEQLLDQHSERLKEDAEIYGRLAAVLWQLFWKALPSLGPDARGKVFNQNLIPSLRHGLDIKLCLQRLLNLYEFGLGPNREERNRFLHSLESNQEHLGQQPIALKIDGEASPTVQNWLKDYNFSAANQVRRGKLEEINYLNSSSNVRLLTTEEKDILSQIISIYDWLKFPPPGPEIVGGPESQPKIERSYVFAEKIQPPIPPPMVPKPIVSPPVLRPPIPKKESRIEDREYGKELPPPPRPPAERAEPAVGEQEFGAKPIASVTLGPVHGRIISEEIVARPQTQKSRIRNDELGKKGAIEPKIPEPKAPPGAVPRTTSLNEDLYRSTLDELAKTRQEYEEKPESRVTNGESRGEEVVKPPPAPEVKKPEPSKKAGFDESLYQSTLNELSKIRQAYEKPKAELRIKNPAFAKASAGRQELGKEASNKAEPPANLPQSPIVSVNEALVRAGAKEPLTGQGQMIAGSEDAVEKKLKELEKKIDSDAKKPTN